MNPYEVLGVNPPATAAEIKAAYRALVQIYHPDRYAGSPQPVREHAEARMKQLTAAYELLQNGGYAGVAHDFSNGYAAAAPRRPSPQPSHGARRPDAPKKSWEETRDDEQRAREVARAAAKRQWHDWMAEGTLGLATLELVEFTVGGKVHRPKFVEVSRLPTWRALEGGVINAPGKGSGELHVPQKFDVWVAADGVVWAPIRPSTELYPQPHGGGLSSALTTNKNRLIFPKDSRLPSRHLFLLMGRGEELQWEFTRPSSPFGPSTFPEVTRGIVVTCHPGFDRGHPEYNLVRAVAAIAASRSSHQIGRATDEKT